jgi:hypothetical protein
MGLIYSISVRNYYLEEEINDLQKKNQLSERDKYKIKQADKIIEEYVKPNK